MKSLILALSVFASPVFADIVCNDGTIYGKYIPQLREAAEWDNAQLYPYAQKLCGLDSEREALRKTVKNTAINMRYSNPRICDDLGLGMRTSPACDQAHAEKVNRLIDNCIETMRLGHNPHNVMIPIDEVRVEVACLKATAVALQNQGL